MGPANAPAAGPSSPPATAETGCGPQCGAGCHADATDATGDDDDDDDDDDDMDEIEIDFGGADPSAIELWEFSKETEDEAISAKMLDLAIIKFNHAKETGLLQDKREHLYAHASALLTAARETSTTSLFNESLLVIQSGLALDVATDPFDLDHHGLQRGAKMDFYGLTIEALLVFAEVLHTAAPTDEDDDENEDDADASDKRPTKLRTTVSELERSLYGKAKGALKAGLEYIQSRKEEHAKSARQYSFFFHLRSIENFAQYLSVQGNAAHAQEIYAYIESARVQCQEQALVDNDRALLYAEMSSAVHKASSTPIATVEVLDEALQWGDKAIQLLRSQKGELAAGASETGGKRKAVAGLGRQQPKRAKADGTAAAVGQSQEGELSDDEDEDDDDGRTLWENRMYLLYCQLGEICLLKVSKAAAKESDELTGQEAHVIAQAVGYFKNAHALSPGDDWIQQLIADLEGEDGGDEA